MLDQKAFDRISAYLADGKKNAKILAGGGKRGRVPELWDGHASERIAAHLVPWLARQPALAYA